MRLDKFTTKTQEALQEAQQLALKSEHPELTTAHLLFALLAQEGGLIAPLLQKIAVDPTQLKTNVVLLLDKLPRQSGGEPYPSVALRKVLANVEDEARKLKDDYVSTEHVLLAMLGAKDETARLLTDAGVSREELLKGLQALRGTQRVTSASPEAQVQALEKYGKDLTELARQGKRNTCNG